MARKPTPGFEVDVNALVSGLLDDMAAVQPTKQQQWGYQRASAAIAQLEQSLTELTGASGTLPRIPHVGPSSLRIIQEALTSGASATVDNAVAVAGKSAEIALRRQLRAGYFSRAEVVRLLREPAPGALSPGDHRADLQVHSTFSDGANTIAELAEAAAARGYTALGITDHSHGLRIARGMSADTLRAQHRAIDEVNASQSAVRVLKGLEANILADGALDIEGDDLNGVELVLAAPHAQLRTTEDQTARLLRALSSPGVCILAHPRGRHAATRAGLVADWDRVFVEAARREIAVEIDGDPWRQDLDHTLARRALAAGCLLALDSDAHATDQLVYAETAVAHARLAGAPADRIVNCWPVDRLLDWLERRRPRLSAASEVEGPRTTTAQTRVDRH